VHKVRETARASKAPVFGIALDGDGDRGFLLVYDAGADEVRIVDGDRVAYLLARRARRTAGRFFAGTVESDLALFKAVENLGIETAVMPVGDKWLSARPEFTAHLLVGEESSGHVVWPVAIGANVVVTGNGLLTGLCAAAAAVRLGLSSQQMAEPFPPGVVKTFYTYFVERAMLHRGSPVWRADAEIANAELERLKTAGALPAKCGIREMVFEDDRDMLYLRIERGSELLGAVFARNSGTENKTATYARGLREFEQGLVAIARAVNANHVRMMRDERLPEARAGVALVAALRVAGSLALSDARKMASREGVEGEARFFALLFALTKEGVIRRTDEELRLVEGS
jgi:phosphomannomutase